MHKYIVIFGLLNGSPTSIQAGEIIKLEDMILSY